MQPTPACDNRGLIGQDRGPKGMKEVHWASPIKPVFTTFFNFGVFTSMVTKTPKCYRTQFSVLESFFGVFVFWSFQVLEFSWHGTAQHKNLKKDSKKENESYKISFRDHFWAVVMKTPKLSPIKCVFVTKTLKTPKPENWCASLRARCHENSKMSWRLQNVMKTPKWHENSFYRTHPI